MGTLSRALVTTFFVALPSLCHAAPGDFDPAFGTGGVVTTLVGASSAAHATALMSDGSIVVAGSSDGKVLVMRYDSSGVLVPGFGTGGVVTSAIGDSATANAVVVQSGDRIVVAGSRTISGVSSVVLAR